MMENIGEFASASNKLDSGGRKEAGGVLHLIAIMRGQLCYDAASVRTDTTMHFDCINVNG